MSGVTHTLTLVGRSYCHLCDDMQVAIQRFVHETGAQLHLSLVDLDDHPELEDTFGELVPVLLVGDGVDGREICHHFLDDSALAAALGVPQQIRHAA